MHLEAYSKSQLLAWLSELEEQYRGVQASGRDPQDRNIRLAPSYPSADDVDRAMQVFVTCVQLCSVEKRLRELEADG